MTNPKLQNCNTWFRFLHCESTEEELEIPKTYLIDFKGRSFACLEFQKKKKLNPKFLGLFPRVNTTIRVPYKLDVLRGPRPELQLLLSESAIYCPDGDELQLHFGLEKIKLKIQFLEQNRELLLRPEQNLKPNSIYF